MNEELKANRSPEQACPNHFAVPKSLRYRRTVRDGKGLLKATALPADYERRLQIIMLKTAQAKWQSRSLRGFGQASSIFEVFTPCLPVLGKAAAARFIGRATRLCVCHDRDE